MLALKCTCERETHTHTLLHFYNLNGILGEMAQWFRALVNTEDPSLALRTHIFNSQCQGIQCCLLLASEGTMHACGAHMYTQAK